ncbi:MAG: hypothetical protein E6G30_03940 [Actinobacteria bacterium]|nr:MAG: hypothetical protein E6G30_03940 [Actinomycetota bacterium]
METASKTRTLAPTIHCRSVTTWAICRDFPRRASSGLTNWAPQRPPSTVTRNPMYIGMACAYAGATLAANVLWPLAFLPAVLFVIGRAIVPREERPSRRQVRRGVRALPPARAPLALTSPLPSTRLRNAIAYPTRRACLVPAAST